VQVLNEITSEKATSSMTTLTQQESATYTCISNKFMHTRNACGRYNIFTLR